MNTLQIFLRILIINTLLGINFSANAQDSTQSDKFNNSLIKIDIENIKNNCITDSVKNEILFFILDYPVNCAYGCRIVQVEDSLFSSQYQIQSGHVIKIINKRTLELEKSIFLDLFRDPEKYLDSSFLKNNRNLSHNNIMYLLIKKNSAIYFDKYFLRSNFIATSNSNSKILIKKLQDLAD